MNRHGHNSIFISIDYFRELLVDFYMYNIVTRMNYFRYYCDNNTKKENIFMVFVSTKKSLNWIGAVKKVVFDQ